VSGEKELHGIAQVLGHYRIVAQIGKEGMGLQLKQHFRSRIHRAFLH